MDGVVTGPGARDDEEIGVEGGGLGPERPGVRPGRPGSLAALEDGWEVRHRDGPPEILPPPVSLRLSRPAPERPFPSEEGPDSRSTSRRRDTPIPDGARPDLPVPVVCHGVG